MSDIPADLTPRPEQWNPRLVVNIRGWETADEDEARQFAQGILELAYELTAVLDLSRLEAVVIAQDYQEGLASIDQATLLSSAAPTDNECAAGSAMAISVLRDDEPWSLL